MNLSNILFNNISNKLKITSLNTEKFYIKNLFNQINQLEQIKKKNYKKLNQKKTSYNTFRFTAQPLTIFYIINISFLKTNTTIHVSDTKGNIKLFFSSGNIGLKGKQKTKRKIAVSKLISILLKKTLFINKKPIALHLNNVKFYKRLIIKQLKRTFFLKVIKSFNLIPYNGCRKKKLRRKKNTKQII